MSHSVFGLALLVALLAATTIAGCGRREELEACDIGQRACQEDVYYAVVRARGDGFDPFDGLPPIKTLTREQHAKELLPDGVPERDEDAGVPEPPPDTEVNPWDVSLQWLGLLEEEVPSEEARGVDLAERVAAFYTSETQTVTIIVDPRAPRNLRDETVLLAHELVHAFQDNESDWTLRDGTLDGEFASNALVEGEAHMYESLIGNEIDGVAPHAYGWPEILRRKVGDERASIAKEASRLYSTWAFSYSLGTNVLLDRWLEGGNAAVRHFARHAPRRAIDYLAALEGTTVTPSPPLRCLVQPPSPEFQSMTYNRLGGMNFYAFLLNTLDPAVAGDSRRWYAAIDSGQELPDEALWRAALDWREDQLFIYFDPETQAVALTWRLRFASEATAERAVLAARRLPMLRAERLGNDAVIVGSEPDQAEWEGASGCGP